MSLAEAIASLRDWVPSAPSPEIRTEPAKAVPPEAVPPVPSERSTGGREHTGGENDGLALEPEAWPDLDDVAEFIAERAAIMEFDGGMDRTEARKAASRRAAVKYQLAELYGDPPQPGGGYAIGGEGDSAEDVLRDLRERYGSRLIAFEMKGSGSG